MKMAINLSFLDFLYCLHSLPTHLLPPEKFLRDVGEAVSWAVVFILP